MEDFHVLVHYQSVVCGFLLQYDEKSNFPAEQSGADAVSYTHLDVYKRQERLEYYTELWDLVMKTATIDPLVHKPVGIVWTSDLDIGEPVPNFYKIRTFSWK